MTKITKIRENTVKKLLLVSFFLVDFFRKWNEKQAKRTRAVGRRLKLNYVRLMKEGERRIIIIRSKDEKYDQL